MRTRMLSGLRLLLVLAAIALIATATGHGFAREAGAQAVQRAEAAARLHEAHLQSELERYRALPLVLARDPDIRTALLEPTPAQLAGLNRKLGELAAATRSAVIYVIAADGRTLAASNWDRPDSFVGANYSFRPYFREALESGQGELFALGTLSRAPGLFLAQRVGPDPREPLGVVVLKILVDALEERWRGADEHAFVTESQGVVLITSRPEWRFHTLEPLPAEQAQRLRAEQRYGADAPFPVLPMRLHAPGRVEVRAAGPSLSGDYALAALPTSVPGWTLRVLSPAGGDVAAARNTGRLVGGALSALLFAAALAALARARRTREEEARRATARRDLEQRVADRTHELSDANQRLRHEIDERQRTEARIQQMQDELIQATKLAVLGQVAAGVAHEVNQPLAALRSYADNACVLLERGDLARVRGNLDALTGLADRIGAITGELRAFARKSSGVLGEVTVAEVLDGASLLLAARLRATGVRLRIPEFAREVRVTAERGRLEQVLVNLLQNAIDAAAQASRPEVRVTVTVQAGRVRIEVADNGPGLAAEVREALFTPFVSTKPGGLGLGLVISRDLVAEFGGSLQHADRAPRGTCFVIDLALAQ